MTAARIWAPLAGAACIGILYYLARAQAPGKKKALVFRASLLAMTAALVLAGSQSGLFARSSPGFKVALLAAVLAVQVAYLYTTRFCARCGRMERNLSRPSCARCGQRLARSGVTREPSRLPGDPAGPAPRSRHSRTLRR